MICGVKWRERQGRGRLMVCVLDTGHAGDHEPPSRKREVAPAARLIVGADHQFWRWWSDDDWNGGTLGNFLEHFVKGAAVTLVIPRTIDDALLGLICRRVSELARSVWLVPEKADQADAKAGKP